MEKTGYHATRNIEAIRATGEVRPERLPNIYLFTDILDARNYQREFGYAAVVTVTYDSRDVERTWKPKYAPQGRVVKLGVCCTAIYQPGILSNLAAGNLAAALSGISAMQAEINAILAED